jgi:spore coat protein U-like protein
MKPKRMLRLFLLLALFGAGQAHAALLCTVATLPVAFGSYDALSSSAVDSTGQVSVSCLGLLFPISYTISLSSGGAGNFSPRKMALGAGRLNYNLYSDSARNSVWGDGTGGTSTVSDTYSSLLGATKLYTVYGRVSGSQNVAAGVYVDSVVVTVIY